MTGRARARALMARTRAELAGLQHDLPNLWRYDGQSRTTAGGLGGRAGIAALEPPPTAPAINDYAVPLAGRGLRHERRLIGRAAGVGDVSDERRDRTLVAAPSSPCISAVLMSVALKLEARSLLR